MKENCKRELPFCYPPCFLLGPTGPTGPQGLPSAQVLVGTTTTSLPGGSAEVYRTGTENEVILNFVIPRGEVGPIPSFEVGTVETAEPNTMASVTITPIEEEEE